MRKEGKNKKVQRPERLPTETSHYNRAIINFLFVNVFISNVLLNVDHGILPAASTFIKEDMGLDNLGMGILGSLVYLGIIVGTQYFSLYNMFLYRIRICHGCV